MENCIFCKIVKNKISSYKIYEDEFTYVFLDIAKDVDGHLLIIPKKHYCNIIDIDDEALKHVTKTIKLISSHLVQNCGYEGVNLLNASGTVAGQSVPHLHFHLIPRKKDDQIDAWPKFAGATEELSKIHQLLMIKDERI